MPETVTVSSHIEWSECTPEGKEIARATCMEPNDWLRLGGDFFPPWLLRLVNWEQSYREAEERRLRRTASKAKVETR